MMVVYVLRWVGHITPLGSRLGSWTHKQWIFVVEPRAALYSGRVRLWFVSSLKSEHPLQEEVWSSPEWTLELQVWVLRSFTFYFSPEHQTFLTLLLPLIWPMRGGEVLLIFLCLERNQTKGETFQVLKWLDMSKPASELQMFLLVSLKKMKIR